METVIKKCVRTSCDGNIRGIFAGLGDKWDGENFAFPVVEKGNI